MKWQNKGHEFDQLAKVILEPNKRYYIWGASVIGRTFYNSYQKEFHILGFIDSNPAKQGQTIDGLEVFAPSVLDNQDDDIRVIITTIYTEQVFESLEEKGYPKDKRSFVMYDFIKIYTLYKYGELHMAYVYSIITSRCDLRCKHCAAMIPYLKEPADTTVEEILLNFKLLFQHVDKIATITLTGGEPFLHHAIDTILDSLGSLYLGSHSDQIVILTNGMIMPKDSTLDLLKKYRVMLHITEYTEVKNSSRIEKLTAELEKRGISYEVKRHPFWIDLGYPQESNGMKTPEEWELLLEKCGRSSYTLSHGRLANCISVFRAEVADYCTPHEGDYIDLRTHNPEHKKELLEFLSGYSERGYVEMCKKCNSYVNANPKIVPVGEQL